jgi:hypothetical protein
MPLGIVEPTIAIPAADPDYSCHGSKVDALLSNVIVACLFGLFLSQKLFERCSLVQVGLRFESLRVVRNVLTLDKLIDFHGRAPSVGVALLIVNLPAWFNNE